MFFNKKSYKVSLKGRSGVVYSEGEKVALLEAEMLLGAADIIIYFDRFKRWEPPFQYVLLTEQDRQRIKKNVNKELERKGIIVEWE